MRPSGSIRRPATARHSAAPRSGPSRATWRRRTTAARNSAPAPASGKYAGASSSQAWASSKPASRSRVDRRDVVGEQVRLGHVAQRVREGGGRRDVTRDAQGAGDVPGAPALRDEPPAGREGREQPREQALVVEDPVEGRRRDDQVHRRLHLQLEQVAPTHPHPGGQVGELARRLGDHLRRAVHRLDAAARHPLGDDSGHPAGAAARVEHALVARSPGCAPPPAVPRRPAAPRRADRCRRPTRRPSGASTGFAHHDALNLPVPHPRPRRGLFRRRRGWPERRRRAGRPRRAPRSSP